ncbi:hypothetical protein AAG906_015715 [Vitis piasezkii]
MPPRRPTSSQNSQANNDVPSPLEGLPPMNVEGLYRYLETLAGLVELQARAIETQALGQHSSSKGSSFDDFEKLDVTCSICGKKHWGKPCYKESGACFGCGKHGHMIRDCPENKKFIIGKPKEENKEDKQKPRVQGRMFAMTHQDAQATSDVATCSIQIYTLLLNS